jgi:AcrR family transcriptional regulator
MARRAATLDVERIVAGLDQPPEPEDGATDAMLASASSLLAEYGLYRWSMDDVAVRAGLGRATVYRRFESREELVHAALARDARAFFAAIADAVAGVDTLEDKVVEGFLVGWQMARRSLLADLLLRDTGDAVARLNADPLLPLARAALMERYRALAGSALSVAQAAEAELVAEALVRLGLSFLLVPNSLIDLDDEQAARGALRRLLGPLLSGAAQPSKRTVTSTS